MRKQELDLIPARNVELPPMIDILEYLKGRDRDPNFFMVEFGHDAIPVAYQQPVPFYANRAYLGVETWMRNPANNKQAMVQEKHNTHSIGQNIFYVTLALDGSIHRDDHGDSWFEGIYNPTTALPEQAATEVFLSNVLGDPQISYNLTYTKALLLEVVRITKDTGMIVIRETLTPHNLMHIDTVLLDELGLQVSAVIRPHDDDWYSLECVYKGEPSDLPVKDASFYMFLKKNTND